MSDFHENIFYGYRGAASDAADRERQLEDNTTKALVNTLQHTSPAVRHHFLGSLCIPSEGEVRFALQRESIGEGLIQSKKHRVLLGIVPPGGSSGGPVPTLNDVNLRGNSRPDAWIWGDDFVVLIESKVVGGLDADQMARHSRKLAGGRGEPRTLELSWSKVHGTFSELLPRLGEKDKLLVHQFTQYLEWINMAGFVGFEKQIFDYFFTRDDDDTRKWVKATVSDFAAKVLGRLTELSPFYKEADVGMLKFKDASCWAAFGPKDKAYRRKAHQTFSVHADGIQVFVNIELKDATDKLKRLAREDRKKLEANIRALALAAARKEREERFVVRVEERKLKQASIYGYMLVAELELPSFQEGPLGALGFGYFCQLLDAISLPYVSFRVRIPRQEALELSGQDKGASLIERVVEIMTAFHPFVEYVNGV